MNNQELVEWAIDSVLAACNELQPNRKNGIKNHIMGRYNALRLAESQGSPLEGIEPTLGNSSNPSPISEAIEHTNVEIEDEDEELY